jgi:hypothetical protein
MNRSVVAQIFNLPYRRVPLGWPPDHPRFKVPMHVGGKWGLSKSRSVVRYIARSNSLSVPSQFASPRIGTLRFERNAEKKVTGLRVSTGRVRDLRFARMAAPASGGAW